MRLATAPPPRPAADIQEEAEGAGPLADQSRGGERSPHTTAGAGPIDASGLKKLSADVKEAARGAKEELKHELKVGLRLLLVAVLRHACKRLQALKPCRCWGRCPALTPAARPPHLAACHPQDAVHEVDVHEPGQEGEIPS